MALPARLGQLVLLARPGQMAPPVQPELGRLAQLGLAPQDPRDLLEDRQAQPALAQLALLVQQVLRELARQDQQELLEQMGLLAQPGQLGLLGLTGLLARRV